MMKSKNLRPDKQAEKSFSKCRKSGEFTSVLRNQESSMPEMALTECTTCFIEACFQIFPSHSSLYDRLRLNAHS